ncbi:MAG: thiamine-phosphate pyrophosphorylase [Paracoccaceae bacterium]|jgi:thiamine-phosphate pyrophosphorylase
MRRCFDLSVYLVLDPVLCGALGMVETARRAASGGVRVVQLRDKTASTAERIVMGRAIRAVLAPQVAFVMNDDVDAAIAVGADGLHIGQRDITAQAARALIGPDMLLGVSVHTVALARGIDASVVDYVGVGPVFATNTKADHNPVIGFEGLARIVAAAPVPAVAIGGVGGRHVAQIVAAKASGMAVVSAICGRPDPEMAAQELCTALRKAQK